MELDSEQRLHKKAFDRFDKDSSGHIDFQEFEGAIRTLSKKKPSRDDIQKAFAEVAVVLLVILLTN